MTPQERAKQTRERNRELIEARIAEKREREKLVVATMKRVLSDPQASPAELIEAAKILSSLN